MKKLFFLPFIIAALSTPVQASTIKAYANQALSINGSVSAGLLDNGAVNQTGSTLLLPELDSLINTNTSAIVNFVKSDDTNPDSYFDLGFGDQKAITGAGDDLIIYTLGTGFEFGLQTFDQDFNLLSDMSYGVGETSIVKNANDEIFCFFIANSCAGAITATLIELDSIADNTEIKTLRLFINRDFDGIDGDRATFALAGAYHTATASPVPLPLPAVLFGSGLALLGWFSRRKS